MSGYDRRPPLSAVPPDRPRYSFNWMPSVASHTDSSSAFFDQPPFNSTPSLFNPLPALYPTSATAERPDLPRMQVGNHSSDFGAWTNNSGHSHARENDCFFSGDNIASAAYQNDDRYSSRTVNTCWDYENGAGTGAYGPGSSAEGIERETPSSERNFASFSQQSSRGGLLDYVSSDYTECSQQVAVDGNRSMNREWRHGSFGGFEDKLVTGNHLPVSSGNADLSNAGPGPSRYGSRVTVDGSRPPTNAPEFRSPYGYSAQRFQFGKSVAKSQAASSDKGVRTTTKYFGKPYVKANPARAASKVPLFCEVCSVKLNAEGQALQHYAGKAHARRLRLQTPTDRLKQVEGFTDEATSGKNNFGNHDGSAPMVSEAAVAVEASLSLDRVKRELPSERKERVEGVARERKAARPRKSVESDPLIYCNLCGTSFNAVGQADLHYKGKKHKARVALSTCFTKKQSQIGMTSTVPSTEERQQQQDDSSVAAAAKTSTTESSAGDVGDCTAAPGDPLAAVTANEKDVAQAATAVSESAADDNQTQEAAASHTMAVDLIEGTKKVADNATDDLKRRTPPTRYSCDICNMVLTSQMQLTQHLQGAKHARRARGVPSRPYNGTRKRPLGQRLGNRAQPANNSESATAGSESAAGPLSKRYREDVLVRSDRFYCGYCNATCDTELSYKSHLESGRHKAALTSRQPSDIAYNY